MCLDDVTLPNIIDDLSLFIQFNALVELYNSDIDKATAIFEKAKQDAIKFSTDWGVSDCECLKWLLLHCLFDFYNLTKDNANIFDGNATSIAVGDVNEGGIETPLFIKNGSPTDKWLCSNPFGERFFLCASSSQRNQPTIHLHKGRENWV